MRFADRVFVPGTAAATSGLAVTQTIGYGTLFYSFTILSGEFAAEFGWSRSFVFGVFSVGLLASGLAAPFVGSLLDRAGARRPMALGSLMAAASLLAMAATEGPASFIAAAIASQLASALVLYEAAFIAVAQAGGQRARLGITQITLVAGFASTIFWPFIVWLLGFLDWRQVYLVLAGLNALMCAPIHWWALPGRTGTGTPVRAVTPVPPAAHERLGRAPPRHAMLLLGICFCGGAVAITATQIHLVGILAGLGFDVAAAAGLGALIGPFQVGARVTEIAFGRRRSPMVSGLVSTIFLTFGLALLLLAGASRAAAIGFAAFYGIGQGLTYIVRGAVPLYLFGADGYGRITGRLNSARLMLSGAAPFGFAWLVDRWGEAAAVIVLAGCAGVAAAAFLALSVQARH